MEWRQADPAAIEAEIDHIRSLGLEQLRARWRATFGLAPPRAPTKDLIARMITYRLQEEAFGGLDPQTVRLLDRLAQGKKSEVGRRLKPGTVIVREYGGEQHTVTVVPDGFLWREATYSSLSVIAKAITGTAWNGPRFFGLRKKQDTADGSSSTPEGDPIHGLKPKRSSARASVRANVARRPHG
jgi:hypothetical protein